MFFSRAFASALFVVIDRESRQLPMRTDQLPVRSDRRSETFLFVDAGICAADFGWNLFISMVLK